MGSFKSLNTEIVERLDQQLKGLVRKYLLGRGGGGAEGIWWSHEIILAGIDGSPNIFNDDGCATKHTNKVSA